MNILYLPLKKEWYEMIEAGIKKEEYREFKPYWLQRLMLWADGERIDKISAERVMEHPIGTFEWGPQFKDYDAVCFSYGYTRRRMLWECKGIDFGRGRPEWGAPDHKTFIIKLGNRLNDERLQ